MVKRAQSLEQGPPSAPAENFIPSLTERKEENNFTKISASADGDDSKQFSCFLEEKKPYKIEPPVATVTSKGSAHTNLTQQDKTNILGQRNIL